MDAPPEDGPPAQRRESTGDRPLQRSSPRALRVLVLLLLAPFLLIGPSLLPGKRFLPQLPAAFEPLAREDPEASARAWQELNFNASDRLFPALTDQLAIRDQLLHLDLPTWEPNLGLGMPLFANTMAGVLYPPNWLAVLLPPDLAAGPLAILTLLLAGLGMWLFLRRLGLGPGAAAVGALALQTGGWAISNLHYPMKVDAALWLPWLLWAVEGLARGARGSRWHLFACAGLSLLAGFPPIALFSLAATTLYALVRLGPRPAFLGALGALLLGCAGAAIQILPLVEAAQNSPRQEVTAETLELQSLPGVSALSIAVPDLFGSPTAAPAGPGTPVAWWLTPREQGEAKAQTAMPLEWNAFAGIAVLALCCAALVAAPRRALLPLGLGLLCVGFAQGWPGVRLLYRVPGLNLGHPARVLGVAWVVWPWLAALGAQALIERRRRARGTLTTVAALISIAALVAWLSLEPEAWAEGLIDELARRYELARTTVLAVVPLESARRAALELQRSLGLVATAGLGLLTAAIVARLVRRRSLPEERGSGPSARVAAGVAGTLVILLGAAALLIADGHLAGPAGLAALGAAAAFAFAWEDLRSARLAAWLPLGTVILAEGLMVARPHLVPRTLGQDQLFPSSELVEAVREAAGDGRVARYDPSGPAVIDSQLLARPNMLHAYGIADLVAWKELVPRTHVALFEALEPSMRWSNKIGPLRELAQLDSPVLDRARVTCVLSVAPIEHPRLEAVREEPGFCIYHRTGNLAPVRVVPQAQPVVDEVVYEALAAGALNPALKVAIEPHADLAVIEEGPAWRAGEVGALQRPGPGRLDVEVRHTSGGWLVFQEGWAPGWKATVDDADAPVYRADGAFRAIPIPPGERLVVRTKYEPWSHRVGAAISLTALIAALWLRRRERRA